jgi:hypothetical protein
MDEGFRVHCTPLCATIGFARRHHLVDTLARAERQLIARRMKDTDSPSLPPPVSDGP